MNLDTYKYSNEWRPQKPAGRGRFRVLRHEVAGLVQQQIDFALLTVWDRFVRMSGRRGLLTSAAGSTALLAATRPPAEPTALR